MKDSKRQQKRDADKPHYQCGGIGEHTEDCPVEGCFELHPLDLLINAELAEWDKVGLDTMKVGINGFILETQVMVLTKILIDTEVVDQEQINFLYRELLLSRLEERRKAILPQLQRQRLAAQNPLLGPNGRPL